MHETLLILFALLLGLVSGFIGGIATGGGLLAIPGLILMGVPPSSAIATNNLNAVSGLSSALRFHRSDKLRPKRMLPLMAASFFGGIIGSKILLSINQHLAQRGFAIASITLAITFALSKTPRAKLRDGFYSLLGVLAIFLGSIFAGLFGTGGGFFAVYALCYFYGFSVMEATANTKIINVAGTLSVLYIFLHAGLIDFEVGLPMMAGSAAGGYIGAHTALQKGDKTVKTVFLVTVLLSGAKLLIG